MAIPTPDKLGLYYASRDLPATDSALPERSVAAGSTTMSINTTSITQADNYWDGALGFFYGTETQQDLRGHMFHVQKWSRTEGKLYITSPLPVLPVTTDKFRLFLGGLFPSTQDVFCLKVQPVSQSPKQPEVDIVQGTNITGIRILKASGMLGTGTLSIQYLSASKEIAIKMNAGNYGPAEPISASGQLAIYNEDFSGFILVNIEYAALPASGSPVDTFGLSIPKNVVIPNYEGYETNTGNTVRRYQLVVMKNNSASALDAMSALTIWSEMPEYERGSATQTLLSAELYTQPASLTASGVSGWPTRGFWIRNESNKSYAYVRYRNGNTLYLAAMTEGLLVYHNANSDLQVGSRYTVTRSGSSPSGSFTAQKIVEIDDGAGFLWFTHSDMTTINNPGSITYYISLEGSQTTIGRLTAISRGFRFSNAVPVGGWDTSLYPEFSCSNGNYLVVAPDFDLSLVNSDGTYSDPPTVYDEPGGTSFGTYTAPTQALIKDIFPGRSQMGLWIRQTIIDGTQSRQNIVGNIRAMWN